MYLLKCNGNTVKCTLNIFENQERGDLLPLFENNYRAAATTELERDIRSLEERDKTAQTKPVFEQGSNAVNSNINFAERIELINADQADDYYKRVEQAQRRFENLERYETREIVNDTENPRERAHRYQSLDDYNSRIANERAKATIGLRDGQIPVMTTSRDNDGLSERNK